MATKAQKIKAARAEVDACKVKVQEAKRALDAWEIDTDAPDVIAMYEEMLDSEEGWGGYSPSTILKNCDEVAYRCGMNDYVDGLAFSAFAEYKELEEAVEEAEGDLTSAEEALEALEEA